MSEQLYVKCEECCGGGIWGDAERESLECTACAGRGFVPGPGWTRVDDGLPEPLKDALVRYRHPSGISKWGIAFLNFPGANWVATSRAARLEFRNSVVTHWHPLPQPPEF